MRVSTTASIATKDNDRSIGQPPPEQPTTRLFAQRLPPPDAPPQPQRPDPLHAARGRRRGGDAHARTTPGVRLSRRRAVDTSDHKTCALLHTRLKGLKLEDVA
ncbi:hypothetical protein CEXT_590981 [Caerostris extrusa]|uniref:Uncharacterized protein n=1 Tax=Caerostris extrusa TaxID=172846 RepID=A0AAV4SBC9_CAEEX|nr:hypothetical protein CEXT_590981 [Caerostris extrusa]